MTSWLVSSPRRDPRIHPLKKLSRGCRLLETIFLVFNEGYSASSGDDWMRPELCEEALRLGRILVGLMPEHAEANGLLALMEIQASRLSARSGSDGQPVLLMDQDRHRWDKLLIRRGLQDLQRADSLGGAPGPYTAQAAIAACHARATRAEDTDWALIAELYQVLVDRWPSPVAELNRAVAVGMAQGPAAGLAIADRLTSEPALASYPQLAAVRGDLLAKLGRNDEAAQQFQRAAELTRNERERQIFLNRARSLAPGTEQAAESRSQSWVSPGANAASSSSDGT